MRTMRCGCGFELHDDDATIEVFNEHVCTAEVERAPRWHESVFSGYGAIVVSTVVVAVMLVALALTGSGAR